MNYNVKIPFLDAIYTCNDNRNKNECCHCNNYWYDNYRACENQKVVTAQNNAFKLTTVIIITAFRCSS